MERAVVMTGIGGQGIQLIAKLLAQAGIAEGRQVMTFGIFGGMIRGGSSEATVVIADHEIVTPPIVPRVWAVLAMHPEGLPKLAPKVDADGVLVANTNLVTKLPAWNGVRVVSVPATDLAKEIGQPLGASMIALGALAAATGLVGVGSLGAALADVLPPHRRQHAEANRRCVVRGAGHVGRDAARDAWA
jgi:Pyruvate/2-oxoacid:ferredoxin oxidoreductase gamma subunit